MIGIEVCIHFSYTLDIFLDIFLKLYVYLVVEFLLSGVYLLNRFVVGEFIIDFKICCCLINKVIINVTNIIVFGL